MFSVNYLGIDIEMQLAHAGDDGLFALLVPLHPEGWILLCEPGDTFREIVNISLLDGLDGHRDDWVRHKHGFLGLTGGNGYQMCVSSSSSCKQPRTF